MELREFGFARYKGYTEPTRIELAPLTILVGANNSGKTALAQAIRLLAGGLAPPDQNVTEPLPLESGGILHGLAFRDLLSGRAVHGRLSISANFHDRGRELSFEAEISNVESPHRPSQRQISRWRLRCDGREVLLNRKGLDEKSPYDLQVSDSKRLTREVTWRGLLPQNPGSLDNWMESVADDLRAWTTGVRHLCCPRRFPELPRPVPERLPLDLGPHGEGAPSAIAADDALREAVSEWYRRAFGVDIEVQAMVGYFELRARIRDVSVRLAQSGRGLSHVLPVAVTALTAVNSGPGVDIIEHPEAELHPAAHAHVAELLLDNLAGRARPLIVETHSEMLLLRARRWIAEGRLPPTDVLVYWVDVEPNRGSVVRQIRINEQGDLDDWPDGVFIEDYEEFLAIRRANRPEV